MKCALIRWWMEEYIDGTLDGRRARWIQAHLQHCQACAQELVWRRSLRDALKPEPFSVPPQEMWQDFQRRLAERTRSARAPRVTWWQVGTVTAAVACALVLGAVWWKGYMPVSKPTPLPTLSGGQQFASGNRQHESPAANIQEAPALSMPTRSPAVKPMRIAKATPVKPPASPMQLARMVKQTAKQQQNTVQQPQAVVSMAYAEVRNEQGELVSRVFLQTTYDENGQPRAVQIECNAPTAVEVENNVEPMDSSDTRIDNGGSAGSPAPAAGTRPGLSD